MVGSADIDCPKYGRINRSIVILEKVNIDDEESFITFCMMIENFM